MFWWDSLHSAHPTVVILGNRLSSVPAASDPAKNHYFSA
jgi:hypothetical protein